MDKNSFETYEYLSAANVETDADQFFVIQDDGTILLNRQVQYVTEVQDVKEGIDNSAQACAVYDMNPQQFFVDVVNNPAELISVSDNYILPTPTSEDATNIYGNSFLFQTVGTEAAEQSDKDLTVTVQFKEAEPQDVGTVNVTNKQENTCTEITLTDDQYKTLEQKGWVLLESNGKIFILDAFGLHEVTSNIDLIQSLKDETKIDLPVLPSEVDSTGSLKQSEIKIENLVVENTLSQSITYESHDEPKEVGNENMENDFECIQKNNMEEIKTDNEVNTQDTVNKLPKETRNDITTHLQTQKPKRSKIKILTKYSFKDIPDKILLGRTKTGKNLVAKVVKRTVSSSKEKDNYVEPQGGTVEPVLPTNTSENSNKESLSCTDDAQFWRQWQVQTARRGEVSCSSREVLHVSGLVTQLFQVPEFHAAVAGRSLVVTRVTNKTSLDNAAVTNSFVTGIVKSVEKGLVFIHVPHLLQKLALEQEELYSNQSTRSILKPVEKTQGAKVLQVHITETKHNGADAISFLLIERVLPCNFNSKALPRKVMKLHACSTCASIFQTEAELTEHQESHSMDSEGALTIDTDKLPKMSESFGVPEKLYYTVKSKKGTQYCCLKCQRQFITLSNCLRHVRNVHTGRCVKQPTPKKSRNASDKNCDSCDDPNKGDHNDDQDVIEFEPNDAPYKCKMCTSAYFYSASLSKHINKAHIKEKANSMIQA